MEMLVALFGNMVDSTAANWEIFCTSAKVMEQQTDFKEPYPQEKMNVLVPFATAKSNISKCKVTTWTNLRHTSEALKEQHKNLVEAAVHVRAQVTRVKKSFQAKMDSREKAEEKKHDQLLALSHKAQMKAYKDAQKDEKAAARGQATKKSWQFASLTHCSP